MLSCHRRWTAGLTQDTRSLDTARKKNYYQFCSTTSTDCMRHKLALPIDSEDRPAVGGTVSPAGQGDTCISTDTIPNKATTHALGDIVTSHAVCCAGAEPPRSQV